MTRFLAAWVYKALLDAGVASKTLFMYAKHSVGSAQTIADRGVPF